MSAITTLASTTPDFAAVEYFTTGSILLIILQSILLIGFVTYVVLSLCMHKKKHFVQNQMPVVTMINSKNSSANDLESVNPDSKCTTVICETESINNDD